MSGEKRDVHPNDKGIGQHVATVTTDELEVFSALHGQETVPFPFTSDWGSSRTVESVEVLHRALAQRFEADPPRHLSEWARSSISPDIRLEAEVVPLDPAKPPIRVNAVRRQQYGFVAVQRGPYDDGRSGDVDVYAMNALDLADAVVEALPSCIGGTYGDLQTSVDPHASRGPRTHDRTRETLAALRADGVVRSGFVQVREGRYSEWRIDEHGEYFMWSDYRTRGRYLSATSGLVSCSDARLVVEINRRLAVMVGRVREARGLI